MERGPDPARSARLAEALMAAVDDLFTDRAEGPGLVPPGWPCRSGRIHVGRLGRAFGTEGELAVVCGFGTVAWFGPLDVEPPDLGSLATTAIAALDGKRRLFVEQRLRLWLEVPDVASFEAVLLPARPVGVWFIPADRFCERVRAIPC